MTDVLTAAQPGDDVLALTEDARSLLFTGARTANAFTAEPVTDAQLHAIHELVKWGPTAANTQPMRVLYIRTPQARERLVRHMYDHNKGKAAAAPLVAIVAADHDFHEFIPKVFPIRPEMKDHLAGDPAGREKMANFNAALQGGYYLLAIRAAGLAAGPMGGFDAAGLDAEFFPDSNWRSLMVVNIGKPAADAWFGRLPRLDFDEVTAQV
jgi:3-hydroxypropanoate dehydrogenase